MNKDKTIKIGSRILSQDDLDILLPNNQNIYSQIDGIRSNAKALKEHLEKNKGFAQIVEEEPEFIKHHNNVFSIIGERGSGKTSVLLSIKNKIMKEIKDLSCEGIIKKNDTVLPIIVPQDMDEDSDSLGWIIGFFTKLVEDIEKEFQEDRGIFRYKNNNCNVCGNFGDTVKKQPVNYVKKAFEEVKKSYFLRKDHYKKSLVDVGSKKDYVNLNSETLSKDIQLAKCFKKFIDEYIDYKKHNASCVKNNEALIYIFFDDVDISTRKCLDVLETVIRFLSHSNIVVFVSGNYTTFEETIVINYLYNDKLLDSKLIETNFTTQNILEDRSALKIRKELAYDYLKKVLSPALRYELKKLTDKEKAEFKYSSEEQEEYKNLYELIKENFGLNEYDNFMKYKSIHDENKSFVIPMLFRAFDDKPRGIMNVYYYLESMRKQVLKSNDIREVWNSEELNRFLDIIIDSSSRLNIYKKNIKSVIRISESQGTDSEIEVNVKYGEITRGGLKDKNIIEENLKLDVLCLGMLFDGIGCAINGEDYKNNFIRTKEYDEVQEIQSFLNKELVSGNKFGLDIIYMMKNPFEMFYIFGIAQKYTLRTRNKKDYIFVMTNILVEISKEMSNFENQINKIDKSNVSSIIKYIESKVEDEEVLSEKLKEICSESSELLSFDVEENLKSILRNYILIDREGIKKYTNLFWGEKNESFYNVKKILFKLDLINIDVFNEYFKIRDKFVEAKSFKDDKKNLKQKIGKIRALMNDIFKLNYSVDKEQTTINGVTCVRFNEDTIKESNRLMDEIMKRIKEIGVENFSSRPDTRNLYYHVKEIVDENLQEFIDEEFKKMVSILEFKLNDYAVVDNEKLNEISHRNVFCIIIEVINIEINRYCQLKSIMDKLYLVICENVLKNKDDLSIVSAYLGMNFDEIVSRIRVDEEDTFLYRYDMIDDFYIVNIMMELLKKNKLDEIKLSVLTINKIERALKYKDKELIDKKIFIRLPKDIIERIKKLNKINNYGFELEEVQQRGLIYFMDFNKILRELSRNTLITEDISEEIEGINVKRDMELFNVLLSIHRNIWEEGSTEDLPIQEKIHFRVYALLYAIIVKETTPKDVYEEKEAFYKVLLSSLGSYDEKLRDHAFKLLD